MIFNEKEIKLKNGASAILRSPTAADAAELLENIRTSSGETDFLSRYPEEWTLTPEQEAKFIESTAASQTGLLMICIVNGTLAGSCNLTFMNGAKTAHRAVVALAILKQFWGLGIGSAMLEEMISAAKAHGTEIIELEYMEGNERGRHLYEKFGFRTVAERPMAFKLKDGTARSEVLMQLYL